MRCGDRGLETGEPDLESWASVSSSIKWEQYTMQECYEAPSPVPSTCAPAQPSCAWTVGRGPRGQAGPPWEGQGVWAERVLSGESGPNAEGNEEGSGAAPS